MMKVINLFAAPGTGKTATGQILSGLLSIAGFKVEYVPEFAKFATFAKNRAALSDQIYMFAKQENRLSVLKDANLDYVVMDGPLPLALLFQPDNYFDFYEPLVMEVFNSYENINFYLLKSDQIQYRQHGRNENEEQAAELDLRLRQIVKKYKINIVYKEVNQRLPMELLNSITGLQFQEILK